jgi:hypothetical protein
MTRLTSPFIAAGLSFLRLQTGPAPAQIATEEAQLKTQEQEINRSGGLGQDRARAEALARQFTVSVSTVEEMRDKKQGWGSITIQLAMAAHLVKQDPTTYPTMADALKKVETLRAEGRGWENIAKELGFKLGPVVSDVQQARRELRAEARGDARVEKERDRGRADLHAEGRLDRPDRPARPERPERPAKPERPERPGR